MARYRAEHNQELQGYFVEIPDNPFDPRYNQVGFGIPRSASTTHTSTTELGQLGTPTQRVNSTGPTYLEKRNRIAYLSAAGANSNAGVEYFTAFAGPPANAGWLNNAAGYTVMISGGIAATSATMRWWIGLYWQLIIGVAVPSTLTDCLLFGADDADVNLQLMYNDAAGVCTKIDLGPSWPAKPVGACYQLIIKKAANTISSWDCQLTRLDIPMVYETTISGANVPTFSVQQNPMFLANNGAAGGVIEIDTFGFWSGSLIGAIASL